MNFEQRIDVILEDQSQDRVRQVSVSEIKNYIDKNDYKGLAEYLYAKLTTAINGVDIYNKLLKFKSKYNAVVNTAIPSDNPGWAQWNLTKFDKKVDDNTYKYYATVHTDALSEMLRGMYDLAIALKYLGQLEVFLNIPIL